MKCWLVSLVLVNESAGDSVAAGTSLSGRTTTGNCDDDIKLSLRICDLKWLLDLEDTERIAEVLLYISSIDCDLAVSLAKVNTCNCCLSTSGTLTEIDVLFFCLSHIRTS